jgi:hypothetical protein
VRTKLRRRVWDASERVFLPQVSKRRHLAVFPSYSDQYSGCCFPGRGQCGSQAHVVGPSDGLPDISHFRDSRGEIGYLGPSLRQLHLIFLTGIRRMWTLDCRHRRSSRQSRRLPSTRKDLALFAVGPLWVTNCLESTHCLDMLQSEASRRFL